MKIAIINSVYRYGSTGRLAAMYKEHLELQGIEVRVYYGTRRRADEENVYYIGNIIEFYVHILASRLFGLAGRMSFFTTRKLLHELDEFNPDVVWLMNLHGYYLNEPIFWRYIGKRKKDVIYVMPDEYAFVGKCCGTSDCEKYVTQCKECPQKKIYPKTLLFDNSTVLFRMKKNAYSAINKIIFCSAPYIADKARISALTKGRTIVDIVTKVDVENIFFPRNASALREQLKINSDAKVVLCCAPITAPLKGVKYFVEAAKILEKDEDIIFINLGNDKINDAYPKNFIALDYVKDPEKLAEYYSLADLYVCTSIVDAMPNTCLEALGCGTVICGFNISGVPYTAPSGLGTFVEPFSALSLANAIKDSDRKSEKSSALCREYALSHYALSLFDNDIKRILSLLN